MFNSRHGHKTLLLKFRTGCGDQATFCRVLTHFCLVRRLRMRGTVTPHLHMSLLHGYILYCKGDRLWNGIVFWKEMTRNFFLRIRKKSKNTKHAPVMFGISCCLFSTFKNLKTIERVLGNCILDVIRICRTLPVWGEIEQWYCWTLYMQAGKHCIQNSAVTDWKFIRKETSELIS